MLLTGLLGLLSWRRQQSADDADWVAHTHEVSTTLELTLRHLVDVETGGRGFALTGDEPFLEPYEAGKTCGRRRTFRRCACWWRTIRSGTATGASACGASERQDRGSGRAGELATEHRENPHRGPAWSRAKTHGCDPRHCRTRWKQRKSVCWKSASRVPAPRSISPFP